MAAVDDRLDQGSPDESLGDPAVEALLAAARSLSPARRAALSRRLVRVVAFDDEGRPRSKREEAKIRAVEALVDVATALGRVPSTTDYSVMQRREAMRCNELPSTSAIIRAFGSWVAAQIGAGLVDPDRPDELRRRNARVRLRVGRYSNARLVDCLQAAARELGRAPTYLDYGAWRRTMLNRQVVSHLKERDVPHARTLCNRFNGWSNALGAAGLSRRTQERPPAGGWSELA